METNVALPAEIMRVWSFLLPLEMMRFMRFFLPESVSAVCERREGTLPAASDNERVAFQCVPTCQSVSSYRADLLCPGCVPVSVHGCAALMFTGRIQV